MSKDHLALIRAYVPIRCEHCDRYCDDQCAVARRENTTSAARGIINGLTLGVIMWALLAVFLFYGFRITL